MANVVRLSDLCTGHYCYAPRKSISGSPNTFVNKRAAIRLGDLWAKHCCGPKCHDGTTSSGSNSVFVNGKPLMRIGDSISCGSRAMTGSVNVFAG